MTKSNKGYTLVELLLTMAIFAIVMVGVTGMMNTSSKSYQKGVFEVQNQEEVQIVTNQLEEFLVDATTPVTKYIDGTTNQNIYKFTDDASKSHFMQIIYDDSADELYLQSGSDEPELLADNVEFFEIDGIANKDNVCKLTLKIKNQDQVFDSTKNVAFRNNVENNISKDLLQNNTSTTTTTTTTSEFKDVLKVDRGEKINLSAKYGITEGCTLSDDAKTYFEFDTTTTAFKKTVYYLQLKDNYNTPANFSTSVKDNNVYLTDSSNNKIKLEVDAVCVYAVDPDAANNDFNGGYSSFTDKGVLLLSNKNVNVNDGGNSTYINVKGINVQEYVKLKGSSVSVRTIYSVEGCSNIYDSNTQKDNGKKNYNLSAVELTDKDGNKISSPYNKCEQNTGDFDFSGNNTVKLAIALQVSPDRCGKGMALSSGNEAVKCCSYSGQKIGAEFDITFSKDGSSKTYKKYYDVQVAYSQDLTKVQ